MSGKDVFFGWRCKLRKLRGHKCIFAHPHYIPHRCGCGAQTAVAKDKKGK